MAILKSAFAAAAISTAFMLGACATGGVTQGGETALTRQTEAYKLGAGDQVRIVVFGEDNLSGEFEVDGSGEISMPLIGTINAEGLTTPELQKSIATSLADGYLLDPRVSTEVINYRPFYILGEVNKPGEYPYSSNLTVLNAVAAAGGFTYRANEKVVLIKNTGSQQETLYVLDTNTTVEPGDTIRIKERKF